MKKLSRIIRYIVYGIWLIVFCFLSFTSIKETQAQGTAEIPGLVLEDASFVPVKDLEIGDWVFVKREENLVPEQITKLDYHQEEVEVYNLSVDGEETFFANDFAVHNKAGTDTTKPQCRVIVNPTVSNVNSLVKNRSFESPTYRRRGARDNCPNNWYNRSDGGRNDDQLWCDFGLEVAQGGAGGGCTNCGSQHVELGYPHFYGKQEISGLEKFNSQPGRVLYKVSAWGKGGAATIKFRGAGGIYGTFARLNPGGSGWRQGSLLGWTYSSTGTEEIIINCFKCDEDTGGTGLDLVSLQKLVGKTEVDSLDVDLYVAYYDNRNVAKLRHWNQGESAPGWDSGDSRVIPFGPNISTSPDPIPHTLDEYGSKTINVQVRDLSGNVSDPCQVTVTSEAPTGTITGNVYQNEDGACSGTTAPTGTGTGWEAQCKEVGGSWIRAEQVNRKTYKCCTDDTCTNDQMPYGQYRVRISTIPDGWKLISGASCQTNPSGVFELDEAGETVDLPFYIWKGVPAWFQTKEGDVHSQGTISSQIPSTATNPYFCLNGSGGTPGVVSYNGSSPDFGDVSVSSTDWLADTSLSRKSYNYFYQLLGSPDESITGENDGFPTDSGVYFRDGPLNVNKLETVGASCQLVILVNGKLTINDRIKVKNGGSLVIITKDDIKINGSVSNLVGIFITDGTISTGNEDNQLIAGGSFIAQRFNLQRGSQGDLLNESEPYEEFRFRPDLILNSHPEIWVSSYTWQELPP